MNKQKGKKKIESPFHDDRKRVKCSCGFEMELFYSWSDYDIETKKVEQREVKCPNCDNTFAQSVWK